MPGMAPPAADERSALLGYLAQARDAFHIVTYGLTDEQAAQAPAASELCMWMLGNANAEPIRTS